MSADGPVRRSLENFLTVQSRKKIPVAAKCPKCGSAMSHTLTTFSFVQVKVGGSSCLSASAAAPNTDSLPDAEPSQSAEGTTVEGQFVKY